MTPLYNLGIRLYSLGIRVAAMRGRKARLLRQGQRRALEELKIKLEEVRRPGDKLVWIHAASLGEFEQGRPIIEGIKAARPDVKILLTFFSPSGYEVRKNYPLADVVSYLPMDTPGNVRRFLDIVNPDEAIFVKYEFWGNYLSELKRRGTPTFIVSAIFRPGQIFFRPYGMEFRKLLGCFNRIFVQDERSKRMLGEIGIKEVEVAGDTRFDRVAAIRDAAKPCAQVERMTADARDVLVCGSTWPADEAFLAPWLAAHPDVKAVIAPHEFTPERLEQMVKLFGPGTALLSKTSHEEAATKRVLIIDCFGLLSGLYRYATVAYVGGGFGVSIHNLNEAAVYGIPVIFGPKHQKFKEAFDLAGCGGGFPLSSAEEFAETADRLTDADRTMRDRAAEASGAYISKSIGATEKILPTLLDALD